MLRVLRSILKITYRCVGELSGSDTVLKRRLGFLLYSIKLHLLNFDCPVSFRQFMPPTGLGLYAAGQILMV